MLEHVPAYNQISWENISICGEDIDREIIDESTQQHCDIEQFKSWSTRVQTHRRTSGQAFSFWASGNLNFPSELKTGEEFHN